MFNYVLIFFSEHFLVGNRTRFDHVVLVGDGDDHREKGREKILHTPRSDKPRRRTVSGKFQENARTSPALFSTPTRKCTGNARVDLSR